MSDVLLSYMVLSMRYEVNFSKLNCKQMSHGWFPKISQSGSNSTKFLRHAWDLHPGKAHTSRLHGIGYGRGIDHA